jgi:large subunit ribosomal protein L33
MARSSGRIVVQLKSTAGPHRYTTTKNKRTTPGKLELRKYDPTVRRHVVYREGK